MSTQAPALIPAVPAWNDEKDPAWIGLSGRFLDHLHKVSGRTDLIARAAPDVSTLFTPSRSRRPIASFVPSLAEVRFTTNVMFDPLTFDPDMFDPMDPHDRALHPHVIGAACHEAAHAAHTRLAFPEDVDDAASDWAIILEEPRIEAQLLRRRPQDRGFLRSAAITLAAGGSLAGRGATNVSGAVRAAILFLGREFAGVLDEGDTAPLRVELGAVLGEDRMGGLDEILIEAVSVPDGDNDALLALGARVAALVAEAREEQAEQDDPGELMPGTKPSEDDSDGDGQPGPRGPGKSKGEPNGDPRDADGSGSQGDPGEGGGSASTDTDPSEDQGDGAGSDPNEDQGDGAGSDPSEDQAGESGDRTDADSDAGPGEPKGPARQMPCGSWTDGDVPDDVNPWEADNGSAHQNAAEGSLTKAIIEAAQTAADDAAKRIHRQAFPEPTVIPGKSAAEAGDEEITRAAHSRVFGDQPAPIAITHHVPAAKLVEQTRQITTLLRRAQYRDITRSKAGSMVPPGRMRMGEVMRREAQVAARARVSAQPFKQTRRRETPRPPLRVGISGDISGSMQAWQKVTAELTFALAHAVTHMDGTAAATAWNTDAAVTLRPGQVVPFVAEAACDGGSTGAALSVRALDGALKLTVDQTGARVLVVVTDGAIPHDAVNIEIDRLVRTGVKVLWVTPAPDKLVTPAATNLVLADPRQFGLVIGQALADLLAAS